MGDARPRRGGPPVDGCAPPDPPVAGPAAAHPTAGDPRPGGLPVADLTAVPPARLAGLPPNAFGVVVQQALHDAVARRPVHAGYDRAVR